MQCPGCGHTVAAENRFCNRCGERTGPVATAHAQAEPSVSSRPEQHRTPPRQPDESQPASTESERSEAIRRGWVQWAIGGLIALALVAAGISSISGPSEMADLAATTIRESTATSVTTTAAMVPSSAATAPSPTIPANALSTAQIADLLAESPLYVESGGPISARSAIGAVGALETAGETLFVVSLSQDRVAGASQIACEISAALGRGVVIVLAPSTAGLAGTTRVFAQSELESVLLESLDQVSAEDGLRAFTEYAVAGPAEQTAATTTVPGIELLESTEITVLASTVLPDGTSSYAPENLLDGNLETAWNHCGTGCDFSGLRRQGVGESLTFLFDDEIRLVGLRVANGYQKINPTLGDVWPKNNRIRTVILRTAAGDTEFGLEDVRGLQEIRFTPVVTEFLILDIAAVYEGDGTYNDLAVSEIEILVETG